MLFQPILVLRSIFDDIITVKTIFFTNYQYYLVVVVELIFSKNNAFEIHFIVCLKYNNILKKFQIPTNNVFKLQQNT